MNPGDVAFAFLALREHPYARQMLQTLLAAGFVPSLVIEEDSEVARVEHDKFLERLAGFPVAPSMDTLLAGHHVPRAAVGNHNDEQCRARLEALAPDLIVLGGTRILKPYAFAPARHGTLNAHPGLLPEVRGSASVAWAIELDEPIGCTCHYIEAGIDTGPIVGRRVIDVHRADTYEKLCHATVVLSGVLMTEALQAYAAGALTSVPQPAGGKAHRNMPPDAVQRVKAKLASGRYAHYVD
ncbi:MAG: formyltransferase family protein [Myxococcota bacterium]